MQLGSHVGGDSVPLGPHSTSGLPVVARAVWHVMKTRDIQHFGRVLEFLELIHEQVPEMVCYRHHAKLCLGIKGKMVLDMFEKCRSLLDIMKALNHHFPSVYPHDPHATKRDLYKVHQCSLGFRRLIFRMIRDERFRKDYVQTKLQNEYGESFVAALERLLWELLHRMQSILNHKVSNLDKTLTESPENQIVSLEPSHQLQQRPHSHHRDASDTSSTPCHTCTEDPAGRDQHGDSLSYKSSACSAGEQKLDKTLQALRETSQEFTDPKLASDCRLSRVPVQNVANSQKFLDETLIEQEPDPDIPIFHSEYPNAKHPVFDIFGWDISEALEVNHLNKLSPPNPLQSQEFDDVLLGKQVLPSLSRDVTRSTSPSVGCDVLELPGTHEKSRLACATEQEQDEILHRWQSAALTDVPHQSLRCVGQDSYKLGPHTRSVAGRTTLFNCSVPMPVSFKYQPMVILTQLPVENVSTPNKCTEQEDAKSSASEMVPPTDDTELSYATTWRDSESWMDTCSGDCGSDPDYVPGCF